MAQAPPIRFDDKLAYQAQLERERILAEPEFAENQRLIAELTLPRKDRLPPLTSYSDASLEGRLAEHKRLLGGATNPNEVARLKFQIKRTQNEIDRRRNSHHKIHGEPEPHDAGLGAGWGQQRKHSPGRPPAVSRRPVTLLHSPEKDAA